jgi:hypothetical protein
MERLERSGFIPEDIATRPSATRPFSFAAPSQRRHGGHPGRRAGHDHGVPVPGQPAQELRHRPVHPIALMATFSLMGLSGLTLNIISLGGLALGVGLLLDNAIVMLENIYRHREQLEKPPRRPPTRARGGGLRHRRRHLTNLAAVLPFLLISGIAALIFRELILTLSFAILATLAAALTLVPMLAALLAHVRFESGCAQRATARLQPGRGCPACSGYRGCCPGCCAALGGADPGGPASSVPCNWPVRWATSSCPRWMTATCTCAWCCRRVRRRTRPMPRPADRGGGARPAARGERVRHGGRAPGRRHHQRTPGTANIRVQLIPAPAERARR